MRRDALSQNPHFEFPACWEEARSLLEFEPVRPTRTQGRKLVSLAVYLRDHRHRDLPSQQRSLEAHYDGFVFSQSRRTAEEAKRMALEVSYGRAPAQAHIAGREARVYQLGAEPGPGDTDPRSPAVVAWHDGEMFYLLASDSLQADILQRIAASVYRPQRR